VWGDAVSQLLSGQWFRLKNDDDDDAILYHVPVQRIVYGSSSTILTFRLVLPTVLSSPSTLNDICLLSSLKLQSLIAVELNW
jgi:hypothetical protein